MATVDELILSAEVELEQAKKRRERSQETAKQILERAKAEGRASLSEDEETQIRAEFDKRERASQDIKGVERKLENLRTVKDQEAEVDAHMAERQADPKHAVAQRPAYDRVARIGNEERTYHRGNAPKGHLFLRDVLAQHLYRDMHAEQRLVRHMQEEVIERPGLQERAVGTGAFAGLTVPQYLTDMYAPATAALRPFADICNQHSLPADGMTVNISQITTASGVALQATQNSAVQETNVDDTLLTENVQTAAGQQTISRQAIDRSTGVEEIVLDDLFRRYATALDSTLINQASTGLTNVAQSFAYTDASPTGAELYPKILQAASGVEAALLGFGNPDVAVMHSRRWYWLQSQLSATWPLIAQPTIPTQSAGVNFAETYGAGFRGVLPNGIAVVVDNNISTALGGGTEDEIYVVPRSECHLWEDPAAPVFIRAEQPAAATLGVLLVLYGYFAYSLRRFANGTSKIAGTGLIAPTF